MYIPKIDIECPNCGDDLLLVTYLTKEDVMQYTSRFECIFCQYKFQSINLKKLIRTLKIKRLCQNLKK